MDEPDKVIETAVDPASGELLDPGLEAVSGGETLEQRFLRIVFSMSQQEAPDWNTPPGVPE